MDAGRVQSCILFLAVWTLAAGPVARGAPSMVDFPFSGDPESTFGQRADAGPGFALGLPAVDAESLQKRWRIDATTVQAVTATDPVTGLVVRQERRWVPATGFVLLATTVRNDGSRDQAVEAVDVVQWTFRVVDDARYRRLTYRNDQWYGSTYWTGPDWTRVGRDWHHPGSATPSVRRFMAPRAGRITVTGRIYKADTKNGGGDGVRLSIRLGMQLLWQAEINGDDTRGVEPSCELDVTAGDALRFIVHKRGSITYDTTHWDPIITYSDGARFQASRGFSTEHQGAGGWSYEMEVSRDSAAGLPQLHSFATDCALRCRTPVVTQPVRLSYRTDLPLIILADGADAQGIALAVTEPSAWRLRAALTKKGSFSVALSMGDPQDLKPGQSVRLPEVAVGTYRGSWITGLGLLSRLAGHKKASARGGLRDQLRRAFQRLGPPRPSTVEAGDTASYPELDLWAMIQADWHRQDAGLESGAADSYAAATVRHLAKARELAAVLRRSRAHDFIRPEARRLDELAAAAKDPDRTGEERRLHYLQVRWLKRLIALANPLMRFPSLCFCKRVPTSYSHLVMQYYGWRARPGGGIFILRQPGFSVKARSVLGDALAPGNVLEPRLSYDAERIVFSFVPCREEGYDPATLTNDTDEGFYHLYEVNVDGTGLRKLTSGPYDDIMPAYLPDGDIVFCSTRRRGYARCFGGQFSRRWHVYTLHRLDRDGGTVRTLSYHDTNEWFPVVSNSGTILYSRWDYIDRDAVTHQNLWSTRPDGTNPIAVWGNATARPHCTFQLQPIPHSEKIVFTASAHHSITAGAIAVVDPNAGLNGMQAITRITPQVPFPEAESRSIREYYAAPWPLSEQFFLVAYSPAPLVWEPGANERNALGIYLIDVFGNRELIYRDPDIGSTNPCPLVPRRRPPVLASTLPPAAPQTGEVVLVNVYEGLGGAPPGSLKELRIVQIFPKTTNVANTPPIGMAGEENARAILGTVPIESDGSARFMVPAGKPLLFQVLDADGFAYQTMRSLTYLQPGERVSCVGCHEGPLIAPALREALAARRPPRAIAPGALGGRPFSFVRDVQPLFDEHCVRCHDGTPETAAPDLTGKPRKGFTASYVSLCGDRNFWGNGTNPENAAAALVPRFGARNQIQVTPPGGMYGARGSRLVRILRAGHYDTKLGPGDLRRLAAWIDLNAVFYGAYDPAEQARQRRGELVAMPKVQ